ncbi:B12 binding domain/ArgK/methylmalonyl-CoA mutase family protein [Nocardioidaceae bacterium Broad-1]|uniref:Methylmalonyl-CoA mutase n=1 Tax=Nocardioides panzhihuensis TaxID=860243 RepID=A0A7Z0DMI8_9ACTN|nr:fused isobutyryl-CoA mutase/GTPase IcmF [Nocardioides panzhihuensis]EGD43942.1 B12 binding domain/ArgK/methylmalonyl-CoA mutase family protein [Nocardioidaceae bacterium Broad-1]NYI78212.1 methylmalonyl-CoA mutase [Nocardioides panzhihuensis]
MRADQDPIREAHRQWVSHDWADAADGMAMVTSVARVQQLLMERIDTVLRPLDLTFARYEVLRLLSFSRSGPMPMTRLGSLLQVHPTSVWAAKAVTADSVVSGDRFAIARAITGAEAGQLPDDVLSTLKSAAAARRTPVLGITGTGGSGKSSLTDELVRRFRVDQQDKLRIAVIAVDPTRRKGGGALLGDRIRANSLDGDRIFFRSLATRGAHEVPEHLSDVIDVIKAAGFDLVIVETPGIGQGDAAIVPYVDASLYVMTPEFGAASQLEKIDMLDFADTVAINKFERRGAMDAMRDVGRQLVRNREAFDQQPDQMPVFGTSAATFNDDGVTALYQHLRDDLASRGLPVTEGALTEVDVRHSSGIRQVVPTDRVRYLAEITEAVRGFHAQTERLAAAAGRVQRLEIVQGELVAADSETSGVDDLLESAHRDLPHEVTDQIEAWPAIVDSYSGEEQVVKVRDREIHTRLTRESLSGNQIPRVALPRFTDHGELVRFWRRENLPGYFPYTAGVFPFKRDGEDPARMFAGEGDPARTNRRFKILSQDGDATRLSTAFDSVTLYGRDPDLRPDIYGKVGTSGVSVATLDDMKVLYDGFDLVSPTTSVSMTINGPAPTVLAFFLNTAIDQQVARFVDQEGRQPSKAEHDELVAYAMANVRGTVQADILKEDQGQNTCLFSTEFSLRMMADIQEWFIQQQVRNFYSVSISGYHIAEAGANPISQLAFTLANGFTYVEAYLARGMDIDDFAPNLSFFFSNGMDPEYSVLGRVARRIWAITMKEKYGANERSQKLKYHVQTSGRSLHAQEMDFNDIRTTLQALIAIYDNAQSLHTNAYDEAVTTPTEESVRRALAIQLIINREWGLAMNENPLQGSFIIDELTDLVESAVLTEFDRINERGGVLGAMETGYQRGKIQDESMLYEHRKHDGTLPIIGVNTFVKPDSDASPVEIELARATEAEKDSQLRRVHQFQETHRDEAAKAIARLKDAAVAGDNVFAVLMDAARVCTLQQVTEAFFEVGGQYRRNV